MKTGCVVFITGALILYGVATLWIWTQTMRGSADALEQINPSNSIAISKKKHVFISEMKPQKEKFKYNNETVLITEAWIEYTKDMEPGIGFVTDSNTYNLVMNFDVYKDGKRFTSAAYRPGFRNRELEYETAYQSGYDDSSYHFAQSIRIIEDTIRLSIDTTNQYIMLIRKK